MLGLDRAGAAMAMAADDTLAERIRRLNRLMRYRIVDEPAEGPSDGNSADGGALAGGSDATAIAGLLGVDAAIVSRAEEYLAERRRGGGTATGGTNTETR
jgi:hypothetical protein